MVRSEKTRQFIIEKTASIFNKKGFTGTYLSDLTNATGLTKGSIYGNFKDKNEVAVEAYRYNYKFQTDKLIQDMNEEITAKGKFQVFFNHFKTYFEYIFNNGGCVILNTAIDSDDGNDLLRKEVIKSIQNWHNVLVKILDFGITNDEFIDIDKDNFSYRIIALIEGSIMLAKTLNKPEILVNNINFLVLEVNQILKE